MVVWVGPDLLGSQWCVVTMILVVVLQWVLGRSVIMRRLCGMLLLLTANVIMV